ncbi:MAG: hypothetical protein HYT76_09220 [Deltaproteobacteria bacterium]|nr:hypothetical protein [Deltaproteobacteria bacterium]
MSATPPVTVTNGGSLTLPSKGDTAEVALQGSCSSAYFCKPVEVRLEDPSAPRGSSLTLDSGESFSVTVGGRIIPAEGNYRDGFHLEVTLDHPRTFPSDDKRIAIRPYRQGQLVTVGTKGEPIVPPTPEESAAMLLAERPRRKHPKSYSVTLKPTEAPSEQVTVKGARGKDVTIHLDDYDPAKNGTAVLIRSRVPFLVSGMEVGEGRKDSYGYYSADIDTEDPRVMDQGAHTIVVTPVSPNQEFRVDTLRRAEYIADPHPHLKQ